MPSQYWLVSIPLEGSKDHTWQLVKDKIQKVAFDTPYYRLHVPELRVGTLDSLLALSDDLVKTSGFVEAVTHKIRRQIDELERNLGKSSGALAVEGTPIETYITRFTWDEAKYPVMSPLREIVDSIHESVSGLEDDLKVRSSEYTTVKSQLSAINRKAGGSLLVRDLTGIVKESDIVSSEHMTTLLVVVNKFAEKDWLACYETLSNFVVPQSATKIMEDHDSALFSVVLFRRVVDTFKAAAREKGFQVREYDHDPQGSQQRQEEQQRLAADQEAMRDSLIQWCHVGYGEVFAAWMHLSVIRLFTESILRYGLPPAFLATIIAPSSRNEKRLRTALDSLCSHDQSDFWKGSEADASHLGLTGGDAEVHPYVSITMNVGTSS